MKQDISSAFKRFFFDLSQTFFLGNDRLGLILFLLVLSFSSKPSLCGIFVGVISTYCGQKLAAPTLLRDSGLNGMNGYFAGLAIGTLFTPSAKVLLILTLTGIFLPTLVLACHRLLFNWGLAILVLPYTLVIYLLTAFSTQSSALIPQLISQIEIPQSMIHLLLMAVANSFSEIFYQSNPYLGVALFVFLFASRRRLGVCSLWGAIAANCIALFFSLDPTLLASGYWGFSGVLTAIALGVGLTSMQLPTLMLWILATTFLMVGSNVIFAKLGIYPLALPYIATLWIFELQNAIKSREALGMPGTRANQAKPTRNSYLQRP